MTCVKASPIFLGICLTVLFAFFKPNAVNGEEVKKAPSTTKPTGAMIACDRRVNKAAIMKALSKLPLKNFGSTFNLKSAVYYPAQPDDETFDVGIVADGLEFDVTVTMDEKCRKVLKTEVDKLTE